MAGAVVGRRGFLAMLAALLFGVRRRPQCTCLAAALQPLRPFFNDCPVHGSSTLLCMGPDGPSQWSHDGGRTWYRGEPQTNTLVVHTVDPVSRRVLDEVRYQITRGDALRRPLS